MGLDRDQVPSAPDRGRLTEPGEQRGGHIHEGAAHLAGQADFNLGPGERRDHQQRGEELAALARVEVHPASGEAAGVDLERKEALLAEAPDISAQLSQGVDEGLHRPAPHLGHAVEPVGTRRCSGAEGGEETRRRSRESHKQLRLAAPQGVFLAGDA